MDIVHRTSTRSSEKPSVYDGRRRKDEDDDVKAMENSSGAMKYYTPETPSKCTLSDGTPNGGYQRRNAWNFLISNKFNVTIGF